jgi:hypothetical protein
MGSSMGSSMESSMESSMSFSTKMDSKTKKWIIVGILFAGIAGFLIWCFVAGPCKGDKGDGSPGHWSSDQIKKAISKLPNGDQTPTISKCIVEKISHDISYQDFMKISDEALGEYMTKNDNKLKLSSCFGKKGAWSPELIAATSAAMSVGLPQSCAQCVVQNLQNDYDPFTFITMSMDPKQEAAFKQEIAKVVMGCGKKAGCVK